MFHAEADNDHSWGTEESPYYFYKIVQLQNNLKAAETIAKQTDL